MPGSQPAQHIDLTQSNDCTRCHGGYNKAVEPVFNWEGSMMAQAARDFLFWPAMTVAIQDSMWALDGNPNAADLCERCHLPGGWLDGRSDPPNASMMAADDFDGVSCTLCHSLTNPFFEDTFAGIREGNASMANWDETNASATPSDQAARTTLDRDRLESAVYSLFNSSPFFRSNRPFSTNYQENGGGQFFVSPIDSRRASFADVFTASNADPNAQHATLYSRYHKSKFMCGTCHDVSNTVLANLSADPTQPLPSETRSAYSYYHVERTFSEFMLSAYAQSGGAPGVGPFSPQVFNTSNAGDSINKCQDCHMRDLTGRSANRQDLAVNRPVDSLEHPHSGLPLHDLTGGNVWVATVLASTQSGSSNYDPVNAALLNGRSADLTINLTQGMGLDPAALLAGANRARQQLDLAAAILNVNYQPSTGSLHFHIINQTGHKLISGYPEGRRMFANIKVYNTAGNLIYEVNPYDAAVGTLKGFPDTVLGPNEVYDDKLVYEVKPSSTLANEEKTFHFVLADNRFKDNRIPPKGFKISGAADRLIVPAWNGVEDPHFFTASEYAGGYDEVAMTVPSGADQVVVTLFYQTTSREYVRFLRDEINGAPQTLPAEAYIAQTDPFFAKLKAWGNTIWDLWLHNKDIPGAAPIQMAQAAYKVGSTACTAPVPYLLSATVQGSTVTLQWEDEHTTNPDVKGYGIYYDQGGKSLYLSNTGLTTQFTDPLLTSGQTYCYHVTTICTTCESTLSNIMCAAVDTSSKIYIPITAR